MTQFDQFDHFASDTGATYYKEGSIHCFVLRSELNQFVRRHSGF